MAWIRLSDDYNDHPKFDNLSDGAFRLWHQAVGFCRKYQTDGVIRLASLRKFKAYTAKRVTELMTPWQPGENPLWHDVEGTAIRLHDYMQWNQSKEDEQQQREEARQRMSLGRDPHIRQALRDRDGNNCRYCGRVVSWTDRRGPGGATYDHIDPDGGDSLDNLVIACRGCNSKKGRRTPDAAGMSLNPVAVSRSGLKSEYRKHPSISGMGRDGSSFVDPEKKESLEFRAGRLLEHYAELFTKHRRGAKYHNRMHLDFQKAVELVTTWDDDAHLEKLATIVLTTDDDWISRTDRGFGVFASRATWADDRLREAQAS